jgi:hypothetical protein
MYQLHHRGNWHVWLCTDCKPCLQSAIGSCSVAAVKQSLPQDPLEFTRLYESTLSDDARGSSLRRPDLEIEPSCNPLLANVQRAAGFAIQDLRGLVAREEVNIANLTTEQILKDARKAGQRFVSLVTLAGKPLPYTVCSAKTWDNTLLNPATMHNLHGPGLGGPQLTWIAFSNACKNYAVQVKLEIVRSGAWVLCYIVNDGYYH